MYVSWRHLKVIIELAYFFDAQCYISFQYQYSSVLIIFFDDCIKLYYILVSEVWTSSILVQSKGVIEISDLTM